MAKSGSNKKRFDAFTDRKRNEKIYDVTLSEFADSVIPAGKGRLKKSRNVFSHVRLISTSEDIEVTPIDDNEEEYQYLKNNELSKKANVAHPENKANNQYTEIPLKIWLLLAEYIRPEDIKSFSLICQNSLSVVNTPLFWIRLYKRYYKKIDIPKCLSLQYLGIKKCLKQKVVRSLYYFYSPFTLSIIENALSSETLIGLLCLHHGIQVIDEKDSNERKWLYTFKLCSRDLNEIHYIENDINYNPDNGCRLLKVVCKEFIGVPSVMGMRLRHIQLNTKTINMKFSSAPLSKLKSELGTVLFSLDHIQKPSIIPWWHPDYWDHRKCCNKKKIRKSF